MNSKNAVLGGVFVAFIVAQIVMPKLGLSLALNFDTSCSSGYFALLERVNTGTSSCGASGGFVGFPFVVNFNYNTAPQKLITAGLDVVVGIFVLGLSFLISKKLPRKSRQ